jgi:glycogen debranching enzyme
MASTETSSTTAAPSEARPEPSSHAPSQGEQARKQQVLTRGRSTVVGSITEAVVAKDGEPFFLCEPDGQVPLDGHHGFGLYLHDCRFLRGYELTIGGQAPDGLAATEASGTTLVMELANPDIQDGDTVIPKERIGITWKRRVDDAEPALKDDLDIRNYGAEPVELPLELRFAATFEDVFEIRGLVPDERGRLHDPAWDGNDLVFGYSGADGVDRSLRVRVDRDPEDRLHDGVRLRMPLEGRGTATVHVELRIVEDVKGDAPPIERRGSPRRIPKDSRPRLDREADRTPARRDAEDERWIGGSGWTTSARTSSFALRGVLARSLDDLAQLRGELDGLRYYEAGIPWFATLFGRDSLIAAMQSLPWDPQIAAETLRLLARRQGTKDDPWRDEQPGRILHELRIGELARLGQIPHTPYYGTIDATPLFLVLLGRHAAWTGSLDLFSELRGAADAALAWLDTDADTDGDGFVDYRSHTERGLVNQGWKDSGDAIVMADGTIAEPPIALAEVQGYAYRAWLESAVLFERSGDDGRAADLRAKAAAMRARFEDRFWSHRLGCYVLALANGKPCEVVTSNAGQVLWSGIASAGHASAVAERLLRDDMFGGWGVRTLSKDAVAFHPVGYHLGTVWPHDNGLIASGFRCYGLGDEAERLFLGLLEAAQRFPHDRLPECFSGFGRGEFEIPVRYPVACHPQAWAAGAIPDLLTTILGLEPDGFANRLVIRDPRLPAGIEWVELRAVPIGEGNVRLRFERDAHGSTTVDIIESSGGVDVRVAAGKDGEPRGEARA